MSTKKNSEFKIVGSYRRGALDSGDIDIIIMKHWLVLNNIC